MQKLITAKQSTQEKLSFFPLLKDSSSPILGLVVREVALLLAHRVYFRCRERHRQVQEICWQKSLEADEGNDQYFYESYSA